MNLNIETSESIVNIQASKILQLKQKKMKSDEEF